MKTIVFLLLTSSLFAQQMDCINYEQKIFDSDTCCWRKLSKAGAFEKSAKLIVDYIQNGKAENKQSLNWHAGQMFAFAKNKTQALKYFGRTYNVFQKWFGGEDGKAWFLFAKGTSAFIKRDKQKLEKIITRWKTKLPVDNNFREHERLYNQWNEDDLTATKSPLLVTR